MDLLGERPVLNLNDESWRVYSRHTSSAPQFVGADAKIVNSSITSGCQIYGEVRNSVLGPGVVVARGAVVADSVIMADVTIGEGASVNYAILDEKVTVGRGAKIGEERASAADIAVVGADVSVPNGAVIAPGAMISDKV